MQISPSNHHYLQRKSQVCQRGWHLKQAHNCLNTFLPHYLPYPLKKQIQGLEGLLHCGGSRPQGLVSEAIQARVGVGAPLKETDGNRRPPC